MATAAQVQITSFRNAIPRYKPRTKSDGWLFAAGSAREEARIMIEMMRRTGASIEDTRELIEVPQKQQAALRLYALSNPEDAAGIERALKFRKRVAQEFERLLAAPLCSASDRQSFSGQF